MDTSCFVLKDAFGLDAVLSSLDNSQKVMVSFASETSVGEKKGSNTSETQKQPKKNRSYSGKDTTAIEEITEERNTWQ